MRERRRRPAIDDFFAPRGVETHVPPLAEIRRYLWGRLDSEMALFLEIADYLGIDRTLLLTYGEADGLASILPGRLWRLIRGRATDGERTGRLFDLDRRLIIAKIAAALGFTK